tara:strand:- start:106 stop:498 length:393 start_codon:yes stop_codon:yes gene_type:complete
MKFSLVFGKSHKWTFSFSLLMICTFGILIYVLYLVGVKIDSIVSRDPSKCLEGDCCESGLRCGMDTDLECHRLVKDDSEYVCEYKFSELDSNKKKELILYIGLLIFLILGFIYFIYYSGGLVGLLELFSK